MAEATVSENHGKNVEFLIKIPGSHWFLGTMDKVVEEINNYFGEPQTLRSVNNMKRGGEYVFPSEFPTVPWNQGWRWGRRNSTFCLVILFRIPAYLLFSIFICIHTGGNFLTRDSSIWS